MWCGAEDWCQRRRCALPCCAAGRGSGVVCTLRTVPRYVVCKSEASRNATVRRPPSTKTACLVYLQGEAGGQGRYTLHAVSRTYMLATGSGVSPHRTPIGHDHGAWKGNNRYARPTTAPDTRSEEQGARSRREDGTPHWSGVAASPPFFDHHRHMGIWRGLIWYCTVIFLHGTLPR